MGLRIASNLLSLSAQRAFGLTTKAINRSLQRIASGQRINSSRDDAAGLSVATGIDAQRRGYLQNIRNINQAFGYLETAEGALSVQASLLQRMRELAMQASTGTLSDDGRGYLDTEFQSLMKEFNRLTDQTQYSGINLLDGSSSSISLQVGTRKNDSISFLLPSLKPSGVFVQTVTAGTGTFQTTIAIAADTNPSFVTHTDVNGDGEIDLISSSITSENVSIYIGNGNGTFADRTTIQVGNDPYWVAPTDLNGDGNIDLVSTDLSTNSLSILMGNGNGTFQARRTIATGTQPINVVAKDLNRDGKIDLFTSDYAGDTISILLGNGNGTFQTRTTIASGARPRGLAIEDINGDGAYDIINAAYTDSVVSVSLGNGNGTFATRTTFAMGTNAVGLQIVDVNGDSNLDMLTGDYSAGTVSIRLGNGNGTFASRSTYRTGSDPYGFIASDMNGDGILDIMSGGPTSGIFHVAIGNGDGTFRIRTTVSLVNGPSSIAATDINGDGVPDIVVNSSSSGTALSISIGIGESVTSPVTLSMATQEDAEDALEVLDTAIGTVNSARADIGAIQNRLGFESSVIQTTIESLSSAKSLIMETDYSSELAEYVRLNIIQQAGISVLAQANMNANLALKLLKTL